ncbi:MAG: hypothetical protein Q9227_003090 [Pyrenula ochraceoflavens]
MQGPWPQVTNWEDDNLFYLLNDEMDVGEGHTPRFENWSATTMDELSTQQNVWQPSDAGQYQPGAMNTETNSTLTANNAHRKPTVTSAANTEQDKQQQWSGSSTGPSCSSTLTASSEKSQPQNRPTLMQKLMHLGVAMYDIQSTYSAEKPGSRSLACETFPADLAGKVVQVATEFLKILTPLSDSVPHTFASSSRSLLPSWAQASSTTSNPKRGSVNDKHTLLQLIAHYLLLLQLYLLLYQAVQDYLHFHESPPDSPNHQPHQHLQPIWDDLSIGSTPLFQFAEFQIKMVLQVTARLLEEIEVALGLVEGCRVSSKSANEGDGILGSNGTAQFIKMCTAEIPSVVEPSGRGAIIRLQELTDSLTTALNRPLYGMNGSAG